MKEICKIVFGESTVRSWAKELEDFRALYEDAFPIADEREDFDEILKRIKNNEEPNTDIRTYIALVMTEDWRVIGGMVADYHPYSEAYLLTYGVVDKSLRGQGIGSRMLKEGTAMIISGQYGFRKPFATFLEIEDPRDENLNEEQRKVAIKRLHFMARHGMEVVPIDYTKPPLSEKKDSLKLLLLRYPKYSENRKGKIDAGKLRNYLYDFYDELAFNYMNTPGRAYLAGGALGVMDGQIRCLQVNDQIKTIPVKDFLRQFENEEN